MIGTVHLLREFSLFPLFPNFSLYHHLPITSSSPLMFSGELDSRESSDLFSSRASVYHDHRLHSFSDTSLSASDNPNNLDRHFTYPEQSSFSRTQGPATIYSTSLVCFLVLLGSSSTFPKKRPAPQTPGFVSSPPYDPGMGIQIGQLREENVRLRYEKELAIEQARTWK